ncbi:glycosyltransferase family 2 protein [Brevundimonas pondensis]|uniref:Glycosyltransferase n=1 Tax=Brevundimonas pondensis TaxID=2774189 RepID=A0ABX7SK85_9CAUL|nr:hypothetical protein [Brevundimonas pondensis]QTC88106.1 hypothetical protein IFE19_01475 [Brevundimonas pondensis]
MTVKVMVGIPARDTVMTGFAHSLAVMMGASACVPDLELRLVTQSGTLICDQRSKLAQSCLDEGCDWLMMLDSDMRFPADTLLRLLKHNEPIVTANYSTRRSPSEPVAFRSLKTCEKLYTEAESEGLEECAANGMGVSLIHRSVFEAMEKPWFYIPYIPASDGHWGEDVWFCNQARKAGFATLVDHDLSRSVKHIGLREYDYIDALAVKDEVVAKWRSEHVA